MALTQTRLVEKVNQGFCKCAADNMSNLVALLLEGMRLRFVRCLENVKPIKVVVATLFNLTTKRPGTSLGWLADKGDRHFKRAVHNSLPLFTIRDGFNKKFGSYSTSLLVKRGLVWKNTSGFARVMCKVVVCPGPSGWRATSERKIWWDCTE
jgi:hypothetical protein